MKLRILGDAIRLRLTQGEVAELAQRGTVKSAVHFDASMLTYAITCRHDTRALRAEYRAHTILILAPSALVREWATSEVVGLYEEQPLSDGASVLRIAIEKDFACLSPRIGEDDSDAFSNPRSTC